jgi:16S rRNA (cytidine1402-2'-O)-methyltransferase
MSKLILIPTPIVEDSLSDITEFTKQSIQPIRHFVVENLRTARRVLRKYDYKVNFDDEVSFFEYDKHIKASSIAEVEKWFKDGNVVGLMSEAGMPCIADPGNEVVRLAHRLGVSIEVLSGPSSILMALVTSGLNGQNFAFNGYLPIEQSERLKKLKLLEARVLSENQAQLFMETPYRNQGLFDFIIKNCSAHIYLGIAANISGGQTIIRTMKVEDWRRSEVPQLHKLPTIFSLGV